MHWLANSAASDSEVGRADDPGEHEDPDGVGEALHEEFIVLKVLVAHVEHLVAVNVGEDKDGDGEPDDHIHARQVQKPSADSDREADDLLEPEQ